MDTETVIIVANVIEEKDAEIAALKAENRILRDKLSEVLMANYGGSLDEAKQSVDQFIKDPTP